MTIASRQEPLILLIGDILLFLTALWITLIIRYAEVPSWSLFYSHIVPFSFLFIAWVIVFFIAGLYDKHTTFLRSKLPSVILNAQTANIILAATFFFLVPQFHIAPKTNLALYLVISSLLILIWRTQLFPFLGFGRRQKAILVGYGDEVRELVEEVNGNPRYHLEFVLVAEVDGALDANIFQEETKRILSSGQVTAIVADIKSRKTESLLPFLYQYALLEESVVFLDIHRVYEEIFDRVPLSALRENWILENLSSGTRLWYDSLKRLMDIVGGLAIGVVTIAILPLITLLMRLEGRGPVFIAQHRIGRYGKDITVYKIRTMERNEDGVWLHESTNKVTRLGSFLRKLSIDEFPQALAVLKGDLSLIGPRSDVSNLGARLAEEIPFYNTRYLIRPGITGWAQIKQSYNMGNISPQTTEENITRLAYDLFYLKHRSFLLDVMIAFRTIAAILSRVK